MNRATQAPEKPAPPFLSGSLWLDFVNTMIRGPKGETDLLETSTELKDWLIAAGLLKDGRESALTEAEGASLHDEALRLREALRCLVEALLRGKKAPQRSITVLNRLLELGAGFSQLLASSSGYREQFVLTTSSLLTPLLPVARSVADFLLHEDASLIKRCANPACVMIFYDTTKNHHRRFCSSAVCGNRAKVAAHYARQKQDLHESRGN